jgi:hypothetical protein
MTGAGFERSSAPEHFQKGSSQLEYGNGDLILTQNLMLLPARSPFARLTVPLTSNYLCAAVQPVLLEGGTLCRKMIEKELFVAC